MKPVTALSEIGKASHGKIPAAQKGKRGTGNDPSSLLGPLTPKRLKRDTRAAVKLRYGSQQNDLGQAIQGSGLQQQHISDWFGDYLRNVDAARQQSADAYAKAGSQFSGQIGSAYDASVAQNKQLSDQASADAAKRGATPSADNANIAQRATDNRRSILLSQLGGMGERGANTTSYLAGRRVAGKAGEVSAHLGETTRLHGLEKDLRALKGEKGAYATTYRSGVLSDLAKNQLTAEALGVKTQQEQQKINIASKLAGSLVSDRKAKQKAAHHTAMLADRKYRLDVKKFGADRAKDLYQRAHGLGPYKVAKGKGSGGGKSGGTTTDRNAGRQIISGINRVFSRFQSLRRTKGTHYAYQWLRSQNVDRDYINAAGDLVIHGHLSSTNRKRILARLKGTGIKLPGGW